MDLVSALLALVALAVAVLALREARAAHRRAALPPPRPAAPPASADPEAVRSLERALANQQRVGRAAEDRVNELERRLKNLRERFAAAERAREKPPREAETPPDPHALITQHLEANGYVHVRIMDGDGATRWVSAERHGVRLEGRARIDASGEVDVSMLPTTRAFP